MANYIFAYHGGTKPKTREDGAEHMKKWKTWLEGLGNAVINPGTPLGQSRIVSATGVSEDGGQNPMSGFSVIEADTLDTALEMARACPTLEIGGTIEVAEMMAMK